ncbi:MAG: manganese efflux pump MntP family protein [Desulfovibrio sp.]|jgi:putative Mn2+ efflux pump MntP|nr:manganese efflux pump MntP family protein [Desulfovibrio sp.]
MDAAEILLVSLALAMDAMAVSLTTGAAMERADLASTLRMAGAFGVFQFLMPLCGWLLGISALHLIEDYDHWLAFILLFFTGANMIRESFAARGKDGAAPRADPTKGGRLLLLALATSLDALAVGLSLALIGENVPRAALVIGLVCFSLSAAALYLGQTLRRAAGLERLGGYANAAGGLVLIGIGLNILRSHGIFN